MGIWHYRRAGSVLGKDFCQANCGSREEGHNIWPEVWHLGELPKEKVNVEACKMHGDDPDRKGGVPEG